VVAVDLSTMDLGSAKTMIAAFEPIDTGEGPLLFTLDLTGSRTTSLPPISFRASDVQVTALLYGRTLAALRLNEGVLPEATESLRRPLPAPGRILRAKVHGSETGAFAAATAIGDALDAIRIDGIDCPRFKRTDTFWKTRTPYAFTQWMNNARLYSTEGGELAVIALADRKPVPLTSTATATFLSGSSGLRILYLGDELGRIATATVSGDRLLLDYKIGGDPARGPIFRMDCFGGPTCFTMSGDGAGLWFFNHTLSQPIKAFDSLGPGRRLAGSVISPAVGEALAVHPSSASVWHYSDGEVTEQPTGDAYGLTVIGLGPKCDDNRPYVGGQSGEIYRQTGPRTWSPLGVHGGAIRTIAVTDRFVVWSTEHGDVGTYSAETGTCAARLFDTPLEDLASNVDADGSIELEAIGPWSAEKGVPITYLNQID
jgi:hypothetical protein